MDNSKLIAALEAMRNPKKDTNAYKYKYARLDQVIEIVQAGLATQGLGLRQQSVSDGQGGYQLLTIVIDKDEQVVVDTRRLLESDDAQVKGSYETYMRRYALLTAFSLAAEDDDGALTKPVQPTKSNAPISGTTERQKLYSAISALKRNALSAGITEVEIRSWMTAQMKNPDGTPKAFEEYSLGELAGLEKYLQGLVHDNK